LQRLGRHEEAIAAAYRHDAAGGDLTTPMRGFSAAESLDALKRDAEALAAWDEVLGLGDLRTMNFPRASHSSRNDVTSGA
jgi:hypothetical protein